MRVCFLNFKMCDYMITPHKVRYCTVTEHKEDIEGLSCGPFKITICGVAHVCGLCLHPLCLSRCLVSVSLFCSLFYHLQLFSPSASTATWAWWSSLPLRSRQACGGSAPTQTHQTQSPAGSPAHLQSRRTSQCNKKRTISSAVIGGDEIVERMLKAINKNWF